MEYQFIFDMIKKTRDGETVTLASLKQKELLILEHVYCNCKATQIKRKMRTYIEERLRPEYDTLPDLYNILKRMHTLRDEMTLCADICKYLEFIYVYYGPQESRRAGKVIFREIRIPGIAKRDVQEELRRRKIRKD